MTTINSTQLKALEKILSEYEQNSGGLNNRHGYFQTSNMRHGVFFDSVFFELYDTDFGNCVSRGFIDEFGKVDITDQPETPAYLTNDEIANKLD